MTVDQLTQLILHCQEAKGMLSKIEHELTEYRDTQLGLDRMSREEARDELRTKFEAAKTARPYPPVYAIQWLNTPERTALAMKAGFKKVWDAADYLNGVKA